MKHLSARCAPRVPKCNSCLEGFNSTLKRCQTEHRRLPLKQFLKKSISIVRQRSKEYLVDKLDYSPVLEIPNEIMKQGRELNLKFVYKSENVSENFEFFAFCSLIEEEISLQHVEMYENWLFTSFDEFKNHHCDIWQIKFPNESDKWTAATCSCPMFDKFFICKHIISIAVSLGLLPEIEEEMDYDDEALFPTKRGRPKKTSKALIKE
ncbi:hypothetical protein HA402_002723 [Bradysia odoriphaga]|nr:hypothetical protein HA402_002723 [Bradysia odoriphaga]